MPACPEMTAAHSVIGRFAPSPSGDLHFGSLLAALASFLDIRQRGGRWLLRIEDLDPHREPPGAADRILRLLELFGLHWDGTVVYQSQRLEAYSEALKQLDSLGLTYPCSCNRRRVRALGGRYDGHCARYPGSVQEPAAVRVQVPPDPIGFEDRIQGPQSFSLATTCGDFIIRRKDGLFAYQLAVAIDDAWQQVSEVLRGADLLDSTPRQIHLLRALGLPVPSYAHIPVASNTHGQKLSKQHFARPLEEKRASIHLHEALAFLGQQPPGELLGAAPEELLQWGIAHWDIQKVARVANIVADE